jgi:hypothetical protein
MADDVRDEAERLVAAAVAAASYALRGAGKGGGGPLAGLAERFLGGEHATPSGTHIATGSAECCVCPVCRAIAAVRDPSPEFVFRMASGASDIAGGITTILRTVSQATARPAPPARHRPPDAGPTWRAATHDSAADDEEWLDPEPAAAAEDTDPWHAATRAAASSPSPASSSGSVSPPAGSGSPAPRKVAKKAVKKPASPEDGPA